MISELSAVFWCQSWKTLSDRARQRIGKHTHRAPVWRSLVGNGALPTRQPGNLARVSKKSLLLSKRKTKKKILLLTNRIGIHNLGYSTKAIQRERKNFNGQVRQAEALTSERYW